MSDIDVGIIEPQITVDSWPEEIVIYLSFLFDLHVHSVDSLAFLLLYLLSRQVRDTWHKST